MNKKWKVALITSMTTMALLVAAALEAKVTQITVLSTTPLFNGRTFGTAGAYEQIKGTVTGEINPLDRRNAVITDILGAPLNANGRVQYTIIEGMDSDVNGNGF